MAGIPNLTALNLPAMPSQAAGLTDGLLGRQFLQYANQIPQQEMAQVQLQDAQQQLALNRLKVLTNIGNAAPDQMASNPQFVKSVSSVFSSLGLPAPVSNGKVDLNAMGPSPLQDWLRADPNNYKLLAGLKPEDRESALTAQGFLQPGQTLPDWVTAVKYNPDIPKGALDKIVDLSRQVSMGQMDPFSAIQTVMAYKDAIPDYQSLVDGISQATLSPMAQANIALKLSQQGKNQAQIQTYLQELPLKLKGLSDTNSLHEAEAGYYGAKASEVPSLINKNNADASRAIAEANRANVSAATMITAIKNNIANGLPPGVTPTALNAATTNARVRVQSLTQNGQKLEAAINDPLNKDMDPTYKAQLQAQYKANNDELYKANKVLSGFEDTTVRLYKSSGADKRTQPGGNSGPGAKQIQPVGNLTPSSKDPTVFMDQTHNVFKKVNGTYVYITTAQ